MFGKPLPRNAFVFLVDMAPSLMDLLLQICNKETANLVKPHPGSVLNLITKQLEGKDCNNLEIDLLDLFIWFYKKNPIKIFLYYKARVF